MPAGLVCIRCNNNNHRVQIAVQLMPLTMRAEIRVGGQVPLLVRGASTAAGTRMQNRPLGVQTGSQLRKFVGSDGIQQLCRLPSRASSYNRLDVAQQTPACLAAGRQVIVG